MGELLDAWSRLPVWIKLGSSLGVFAFSGYMASRGAIWPWGFGMGGLLLLMSFMRPLGPE